MRLIDGDALYRKSIMMEDMDGNSYHAVPVRYIDEAPKIEIKKPRTGKWTFLESTEEHDYYRCSSCMWEFFIKSPYCPNCGAEME